MLLLCGCLETTPQEDNNVDIEPDDVVVYNATYELTYNPVYEEGDRFSYLVLSRDGTFSMSVNTCDGLDVLGGTFFIEGNKLFIVPENYECDLEDEYEECDVRGIVFVIENQNKLVIALGLRCIAEESIFEVEK